MAVFVQRGEHMTDQLPPYTPSREMSSYTPSVAVPPPTSPRPDYRFGTEGFHGGGRTSKAMATWALVLGILPMPLGNLVAIGLGVTVLLRGKDGRNHGQIRAVVGIVLASLWLLLVGVVVTGNFPGQAERDPSGVISQGGDVQATALNVGDCLPAQVAENKVAFTVAVVPCGQPHSAEVFAELALAAGRYPGEAQVTRLAEGGCIKRFQAFVGVRFAKSTLDANFLLPTRASWSQDREVSCMVTATTPTTGTLKGSRR